MAVYRVGIAVLRSTTTRRLYYLKWKEGVYRDESTAEAKPFEAVPTSFSTCPAGNPVLLVRGAADALRGLYIKPGSVYRAAFYRTVQLLSIYFVYNPVKM